LAILTHQCDSSVDTTGASATIQTIVHGNTNCTAPINSDVTSAARSMYYVRFETDGAVATEGAIAIHACTVELTLP
jgi:hypothetical protein